MCKQLITAIFVCALFFTSFILRLVFGWILDKQREKFLDTEIELRNIQDEE